MSLMNVYKEQVVPKLKEKFAYKNVMGIPKVTKATINVGIGRNSKDKKYIEDVVNTVTRITGQKPIVTKAKKSISSFKVKEGDPVGVVVTLRGKRMWEFLDKLVNITFPRVRDFRGISDKIVDRSGNLSIGFKEQIAFPEVRFDQVEQLHGLEINVSTTAQTREEGVYMFKLLGFPFQENKDEEKNNA